MPLEAAWIVEMRGIEPRSEEKTIKISTPLVHSRAFACTCGADRLVQAIPLRPDDNVVGAHCREPHSFDALSVLHEAGTRRAGYRLIRQPVRSWYSHLLISHLFCVMVRSTRCCLDHPHPRRNQIIPSPLNITTNIVISKMIKQ